MKKMNILISNLRSERQCWSDCAEQACRRYSLAIHTKMPEDGLCVNALLLFVMVGVTRYTGDNDRRLELVITSAVGYQLGDDDHGFRVVTVDEDDIRHEYKSVFI